MIMKIKAILKTVLFVFLALGMTSCEDFLDQENPNALTDENFWVTTSDFESGMGSVYAAMWHRATFNGRGWEIMCGRSDLYWAGVSNQNNNHAWFLASPDDRYMSERYTYFYKGIYRANHLIDMLNSKAEELTAEEKTLFEAEARFMRGMYHFYLLLDWGNVAYVDKPYQVLEEMFEFLTQDMNGDGSVDENDKILVWEKIIEDFTAAATELPDMWPSEYVGRATKGAALGYLGRSYLYTYQFSQAATTLEQIIGSGDPSGRASAIGQYELMENFEDLWSPGNYDNNIESVFEAQFGMGGGANMWTTDNNEQSLGQYISKNSAYPGEGWLGIRHFPYTEPNDNDWQYIEFFTDRFKTYVPNDPVNKYASYDPRFIGSFLINWYAEGERGTIYGGVDYNLPGNDVGSRKFANYWEEHELPISDKNYPLMRYADILLMKAEAENEIGNTLAATLYIDAIRSRAKLPTFAENPIVTATLTKDDIRQEIEHQRILEFYGEGLRWYDMQRWEKDPNYPFNVKDALTAHDGRAAQNTGLHADNYIIGRSELLPVPGIALNSNPNLVQNPGY